MGSRSSCLPPIVPYCLVFRVLAPSAGLYTLRWPLSKALKRCFEIKRLWTNTWNRFLESVIKSTSSDSPHHDFPPDFFRDKIICTLKVHKLKKCFYTPHFQIAFYTSTLYSLISPCDLSDINNKLYMKETQPLCPLRYFKIHHNKYIHYGFPSGVMSIHSFPTARS